MKIEDTYEKSGYSENSYAKLYADYRPKVDSGIISTFIDALGINDFSEHEVLDVCCGTGISTSIWQNQVKTLCAIDQAPEMVQIAKHDPLLSELNLQVGSVYNLPYNSDSFDIVTCAQAFHWLEPQTALQEIKRVLKSKGTLILFDYTWPPIGHKELIKIYNDFIDRSNEFIQGSIYDRGIKFRSKSKRVSDLNDGGFTRVSQHKYSMPVTLNSEDFQSLLLSRGPISHAIKLGASFGDLGLDEAIKKSQAVFSGNSIQLQTIYNIWVGQGD